jgi:hypothetical protein
MSQRAVGHWVESYLDYTDETESAKVFHEWTAHSLIAGVLRKKCKLALGRINVYPNMYVVLVAEPGVARKSQAISYGTPFLQEIPDIHTSADSVTREALLQDLETCAVDEPMPDGTSFRHTSLNIIAKEFEIFLGQKTDNTKMLVLLTDLFDSQELPWKYRTKNAGNNLIPSVFINMLGATTPESLASCLPPSAIGGGLTSRILFIFASGATKKVPIPYVTPELIELRDKLQKDLFRISKISGVYTFNTEANQYWHDWYMAYDGMDQNRICIDRSFDGWYSRKPMYILKMSQIASAAYKDELVITPDDLRYAIEKIESVEIYMSKTFRAVGRSAITADVDLVMSIVEEHQCITEQALMAIVWRDIDATKFDNVIETAKKTGRVHRAYANEAGEKGIYYITTAYKLRCVGK